MKKSQIVLGASAFILAIAAAFTSKVMASENIDTFITIGFARVSVPFPGCTTELNTPCMIRTNIYGYLHTVYIETMGSRIITLQDRF